MVMASGRGGGREQRPAASVRVRWSGPARVVVAVRAGGSGFAGGTLALSTLAGAPLGDAMALPPLAAGEIWRRETALAADVAGVWVELREAAGAPAVAVAVAPAAHGRATAWPAAYPEAGSARAWPVRPVPAVRGRQA
jgi:hypothetical protein